MLKMSENRLFQIICKQKPGNFRISVVGGKKLYAVPGLYFTEFLAHPHTSPTPYHIPFQFSPFFYFPCWNTLVQKLPDCSHGLCMHTPDSGLSLSRMSNTGVGGILFQYLAHPSGGDSDLRNQVSITKPLVYHSFHFYPPKEAPIPFENTTIGFSSSPRF